MNTQDTPDAPELQIDIQNTTTYRSGIVQARAYRNLKKEIAQFLEPHGLTMMQWYVLGTIYDTNGKSLRITELAGLLQTTLPYMTNVVNTLVLKGLVERTSAGDSRSKNIQLTAEGQAQCPIIEKSVGEKLGDYIFSTISEEELKTYIKVLSRLAA